MKVLFLDVDGVLVHQGTFGRGRASGEPYSSSFYHAATIDLDCIARLRRVLEITGAGIVVSSMWRQCAFQMLGLLRALVSAGCTAREARALLIGQTPLPQQTPRFGEDRSREIQTWLSDHPEVTSYVVLDDEPVTGHPQVEPRPSFHAGGFLDVHANEAIRLLSDSVRLLSLRSTPPGKERPDGDPELMSSLAMSVQPRRELARRGRR